MALSTVSGILTRIGMGKLGRLGLEPPAATSAPAPASWSTSTSRSSAASRAAPASASAAAASHYNRRFTDRHGSAAARSAGSSSTSRSTTAPGSPTPRCSPTRGRPRRSPSCAGRSLLRAPRHQGRAAADRQRIRLPLDRARDRLPRAWHPPPAHPPLPAPDQRQGRALHPHVLGGWAYGAIYRTSSERTAALDGWLCTTTITADTPPSATSPRSLGSPSEPT